MSKYTDKEAIAKLVGKSFPEAEKIIFNWVKQDKINPTTMSRLLVLYLYETEQEK